MGMPTITIRERTSLGPQGENASVSFDNGPLYDIAISDPFSEQQERQLEWYFEEHLLFPFKDQVKAEHCAKSIAEYGEILFKQVFRANDDIYVEYRDCTRNGLTNVQIEIVGEPFFHRWHWESLKDPKSDRPLVLQATFIRKNQRPQNTKIVLRQSTTINILIVVARPSGKRDVGYRTISRPMVEALRTANVPVQIDILRPGTYKALYDHLRESTHRHGEEGYYHVVHFDLHGALLSYDDYNKLQEQVQTNPHMYKDASRYGRSAIETYEGKKAFVSFEHVENDTADLVEASELASLLIEHHVPIAILNACQSGKQVGASETSLGSRLIAYGVQMVLAMGYSVTVSAAQLLMETLYTQLFAKHDLATSIRYARQELYNSKERQALFNQKIQLEDWLLPVVYQNAPQQLTVREFTPEEATTYYSRRAQREQERPRTPTYGFVGRDVDILQIEKRLLTQRNIPLVRGMGGAGKTTLLQHLHTWWQTTGLVDNVFYFGYDERAWNRQQILDNIARKLLTPVQYVTFQPLALDVQQSLLAQRLRSERHLLILDNLESITGTQLAIQNTLPQEEQAALHRFLVALADGKTLVLLGSRGSEDWLADATFIDNIHDLPGLDFGAASILAERILERYKATKYRDDPNLLHLLKLLDGFPLALEVILANLARQTPKQILEALQAGNIDLDKGDTQKKTESIVRCIDYSHSNLSPEAQQLLLCLAPFTSVINKNGIEHYTRQLQQQSALVSFNFEHLPKVIQEAQDWGLLSSDSEIPEFLHLQPVLAYFLRNRLSSLEQSTVKAAIETAFRQHYAQIGLAHFHLLYSKEPQEHVVGKIITKLEYENLIMALNFALDAQVSILMIYGALTTYLDMIQEQKNGLALGEDVLQRLEKYPAENLTNELHDQFIGIVDDVARRYLLLNKYLEAETLYKRALNTVTANETHDKKTINDRSASIYHQLGIVAQGQQQLKQAEDYFQQALQIMIASGYQGNQANTFHQLGMIAQEQWQWKQAEHYYQQALQIRFKFHDPHNQANTYHQLGTVAQEQRLWEQAEYYLQQALQIKVEFHDLHEQASTLHHLGIVAQEQQQWEQAEYYLQQALQIKVEFHDLHEQASTYHHLGIVAQEQKQLEQAEQYYQKALQIFVEFQNRHNQANVYHNLGTIAQEQQQWKQAEYYLQQALKIFVEFQGPSQARPYHQLGVVALEQQQWQQALDYFLKALETFMEYEDMYSSGVVLRNLVRLWQEASDNMQIIDAVVSIVGGTHEEVEELFQAYLEDEENEGEEKE